MNFKRIIYTFALLATILLYTNVLKSIMWLSRDTDITGEIHFRNVITDNSFHSYAKSLFPLLCLCTKFRKHNTSRLYLNEWLRANVFIIITWRKYYYQMR